MRVLKVDVDCCANCPMLETLRDHGASWKECGMVNDSINNDYGRIEDNESQKIADFCPLPEKDCD